MIAKQEKFLAALLKEATIEKAAQSAGIGVATGFRYLKEPEFASAYREARAEVVSLAVTQLQRSCSAAVLTLLKVATNDEMPASARVAAARAILDMSFRSVENEDLAARLEALEKLMEGKTI